jgi:hypothetical protein
MTFIGFVIVSLLAGATQPSTLPVRMPIPGTRLTIIPPPTFVWERGYDDKAIRYFCKMSAGEFDMAPEQAWKNIQTNFQTKLEGPEATFGDYKGRICRVVEEGEPRTIKLIVVFGDQRQCVSGDVLTIETVGPAVEAQLRESLLSLRWNPQASILDSYPFRFTPPATLKLCVANAEKLLYTPSGVPQDPSFRAAGKLEIRYALPPESIVAWPDTLDNANDSPQFRRDNGIIKMESVKIGGALGTFSTAGRPIEGKLRYIFVGSMWVPRMRVTVAGDCPAGEQDAFLRDCENVFKSLHNIGQRN